MGSSSNISKSILIQCFVRVAVLHCTFNTLADIVISLYKQIEINWNEDKDVDFAAIGTIN